ncbi:MAG: isoprenylcysteine carboxylmethyltransferase family protein [Pseudomonadales bacterium]
MGSGARRSSAALWVGGGTRLVVALTCIGVLLFGGAGTFSWARGWLFLGVLGATLAFNLSFLIRINPVLLEERWKRRSDTKPFDRVFGALYFLATLLMLGTAGMDSVRWQWTHMPETLLYAGLALHFAGMVPVLAALLANPHLETTVRIQTDRDHRVISTGPYRYVRHPMYVGLILLFLGWPLLLGSWVAAAFGFAVAVLLIVRTALEDRTLRAELAGYRAFCDQTRYRLLPGVW